MTNEKNQGYKRKAMTLERYVEQRSKEIGNMSFSEYQNYNAEEFSRPSTYIGAGIIAFPLVAGCLASQFLMKSESPDLRGFGSVAPLLGMLATVYSTMLGIHVRNIMNFRRYRREHREDSGETK